MKNVIYIYSIFFLLSCSGESEDAKTQEDEYVPLPYIGFHDVDIKMVDGKQITDTIYHTVPPYYLLAQDSSEFTNDRVKGKIHVANFFFTSCPSICPKMTEQMKQLQEKTSDIEEIVFLSHTIDPDRDSIPKLRSYIASHEIDTHNWYFLYGEREYIHNLGKEGYMVNAMIDEKAEGGFLHSEHFVLIDREGHVRGLYVGTEPEEIEKLNQDIRRLIKGEYSND